MSVILNDESELLTTRQAAQLVGRSPDTIKTVLNRGKIPGARRVDGFWRVPRSDLLAWEATASRLHQKPRVHTYDRVAEMLTDYGSVSPGEVSKLLGVHVGNARKHLAILAADGRAHRHGDGTWFPGPPCHEGTPHAYQEAAS